MDGGAARLSFQRLKRPGRRNELISFIHSSIHARCDGPCNLLQRLRIQEGR